MTRRFRASWAKAGSIVAFSPLLLAGPGPVSAQQNETPPAHSLSSGNSLGKPAGELTGGISDLRKVPLVNNVPGGVKPEIQIENPAATDPQAVERGMNYFIQFNCVGCHAPNGAGGMGPSFSDGIFKYGNHPANHFLVISHGAPLGMPAWGSVLPANVIWDLVAYIDSISKSPRKEWGQTVSPSLGLPAIEQVPAELQQSATPWRFTEPFGYGKPPSESSSGASGAPPSSGSSSQ